MHVDAVVTALFFIGYFVFLDFMTSRAPAQGSRWYAAQVLAEILIVVVCCQGVLCVLG